MGGDPVEQRLLSVTPGVLEWPLDRGRFAELALTIALTAFGIWGLFAVGHTLVADGADWMTYRATLERLLSGGPLYTDLQAEPYNLADAAFGGGYVYPATSVPLLPLAYFIWPWRLLNLVVLLAGTYAATRRPLAVALMLAFPGTWATLALGNVMPIIVGLLGFAYAGPARWWTVAATAIKVWPAIFLVLAWRRKEPLLGAVLGVAGIAVVSFLTGYGPVAINAEPICGGYPLVSLYCRSEPAAYALGGLVGVLALVARSDRACFAALCVSAFLVAPDWGWAYLLLLVLAVMPWLGRRSETWHA